MAGSDTKLPRASLAVIVAVAAVVRLLAIGKPFYIDEIVTMTVASQPLGSMARVMRQIDASPALFPLLLHAWLLVSRADVWVRLLPAIFGVLAVPVFAAVAARAFGPRAGLAAAGVMAIAPAHVEYALYVRSYSLFTLLAALHVWVFLRGIDPATEVRWRDTALLTLLTAALLYTHYLAGLLLAAEGACVAIRWRRLDGRIVRWAGAVALGVLLFVPGVPLLLLNAQVDRVRNAERPEPGPIVRVLPNVVSDLSVGPQALGFGDPSTRRATLAAAAVVFPCLWGLGVARIQRERRWQVVALSVIAWLPLLLYLGLGRRLVAVRFFLPFTVGYVAVLGAGLASLRRPWRLAAASVLAVVCLVPLWRFETTYAWSYDHRRVADAINRASGPGDAFLFVHPFEELFYRWYLGDRRPMEGLTFTVLVDQPGYVIKPPPFDAAQAQQRVREAIGRYGRVWLIGQSRRSFITELGPEQQLRAWMDATFDRVKDLGSLTGHDPEIGLYAGRAAAGDSGR